MAGLTTDNDLAAHRSRRGQLLSLLTC